MYICEKCGKKHNGYYGSGRFCSATCARTYSNTFVSEEGRQRQIDVLKDPETKIKSKEKLKQIREYRKENDETYYKNKKRAKSTFNFEEGKDKYSRNNKKKLGNIGEAAVITEFTRHDIDVYPSFGDNSSADMIADFGGKLQKIQVKSSSVCNKDYISFSPTRMKKDNNGKYKNITYTQNEVDFFCFYDYNKNDIYIYPNNGNMPKALIVRYTEALTNNGTHHNYAENMRLDNLLNTIENYPMFFYDNDGNIITY